MEMSAFISTSGEAAEAEVKGNDHDILILSLFKLKL